MIGGDPGSESMPGMRRREFVILFGAAAAGWPLAARAQQPERVRRLGVLMPYNADDPLGRELASALRQGLVDGGWVEGRNVEIDYRWIGEDVSRRNVYAAELVAASPNVLFACYLAQLAPLALATRTIPIVFVGVSDPVGSGYVESFARPGGNITGFTLYEASMAGKWLKTIAPEIVRVAFMINPETAVLRGTFYLRAFETAAAALAIEPVTSNVHNAASVEAVIVTMGRNPGGGLTVAPETFSELHRELIVSLAAHIVYLRSMAPGSLP